MRTLLLAAALAAAAPAAASAQPTYDALDRRTEAACIKASGLRDARAGPTVRFSDAFLVDVRPVTGVWPQPHMKGARANMLCIYNRRTGRVETQEAPAAMTTPAPPARPIRDVFWRAREIDGRPVSPGGDVTLYLGSDGMVGGRSGCNNYSARYVLNGGALRVFPPLVGTRMACRPVQMNQETRFRDILLAASRLQVTPDGGLVVTAADGRTLRFTADAAR